MARAKPRAKVRNNIEPPAESSRSTKDIQRIINLFALFVVKGEKQEEKIRLLSAAGYTAAEVATLVGTTPNTVSVTLYQIRPKNKRSG
jgi:DNA-directed RNA polymerase specialized sigma24 family protein